MSGDGLPAPEWNTDRLRLRRLREDDAEPIVRTCLDPDSQYFITVLPDPYTLADAHAFLDSARRDTADGRPQWAIADPVTDEYCGTIGVPRLPGYQSCEIGYLIAPWARGRGLAAEAAAAVAGLAFSQGFARAELHVAPENIASQRTAWRAGFTREAVLRGGMERRDGSRRDRIVHARLPGDPPGPAPRALPDLPGGRLDDGTVSLVPLASEHADAYFAHSSEPDDWRSNVIPVPPERAATDALCRYRAADQWLAGGFARMAVTDAADGRYAGSITLHPQPGPIGEAMVGYGLAPAYRGRGFATRAVRLVADWAFEELRVRRLVAGTLDDNLASQAVLRRAGFRREGVRRAALPTPDGSRRDDVMWALLPEDR